MHRLTIAARLILCAALFVIPTMLLVFAYISLLPAGFDITQWDLTDGKFLPLMLAGAALGMTCIFYWYVTSNIAHALEKLQVAMVEIADGKLDFPVPCTQFRDEIGKMARTLEIFRETSMEAQRMEKESSAEHAHKVEQQKHMEQLIKQFEGSAATLLQEVANAAESMQGAVEGVAGMSKQTSDRTAATMTATTETSNNVAAVASAAEELSAAINEIARQVARSAAITSDAVTKTRDTDKTVQQLSQAAQSIGEVVTTISAIADQINLLALNATIESARAGEAGKGFAVVATEVKQLASQTGKATESIATQIAEVQKIVVGVVTALNQIRGTIDEINGIASTIASAVEEQGAATKEIAMNIQRTSDRVREVSTNVTEVETMAVKTSDNARSALDSVQTFNTRSTTLRQEVEQFLGNIAKV